MNLSILLLLGVLALVATAENSKSSSDEEKKVAATVEVEKPAEDVAVAALEHENKEAAASQPLVRQKRNLSDTIRKLKRQRKTIRRRARKRARQLKGQRNRVYQRFKRYRQKYPPTRG